MNKFVVLILALGALFIAQAVSGQSENQKQPQPILASELSSRPVIGRLNVPLGSIVTIEGRYEIRKDSPLTKGDESAVLLNITSVDGKMLAASDIVFTFSQGKILDAISPRHAEKFRLIAYEAGSFDGDVQGAQQYEVMVAKASRLFMFRTHLNVLKDDLKGITQSDAHFRK